MLYEFVHNLLLLNLLYEYYNAEGGVLYFCL